MFAVSLTAIAERVGTTRSMVTRYLAEQPPTRSTRRWTNRTIPGVAYEP
jgi:hypothetical protein